MAGYQVIRGQDRQYDTDVRELYNISNMRTFHGSWDCTI